MSVNYGSKRIVVGAHYGLRDWIAQHVTGGLLALFTLLVLAQLLFARGPIEEIINDPSVAEIYLGRGHEH